MTTPGHAPSSTAPLSRIFEFLSRILDWTLISEEHHEADDRHAHPFTFRRYERAGRR
jgi:hypothetical protein